MKNFGPFLLKWKVCFSPLLFVFLSVFQNCTHVERNNPLDANGTEYSPGLAELLITGHSSQDKAVLVNSNDGTVEPSTSSSGPETDATLSSNAAVLADQVSTHSELPPVEEEVSTSTAVVNVPFSSIHFSASSASNTLSSHHTDSVNLNESSASTTVLQKVDTGGDESSAVNELSSSVTNGNYFLVTNSVTFVLNSTHGTMSNAGTVDLIDGAQHVVMAQPEVGYGSYWEKVSGEGVVVIVDSRADTTSLTVTGGDATIAVHFRILPEWPFVDTLLLNTTATGADVVTDQNNFPVLVRLNSQNFDFAQAQLNGQDLRFADENGELSYEIEDWSSDGEQATVWVSVPVVKGNALTSLYMYWGNPNAESATNKKEVYKSLYGFSGVYHLNDRRINQTITSATGVYDATNDQMTLFKRAKGISGGALNFNGSSDFTELPLALTAGVNNFTISLWMKTADTRNSSVLWEVPHVLGMDEEGAPRGEFGLGIAGGDLMNWSAMNIFGDLYTAPDSDVSNVSDGTTWHYVTLIKSDSRLKMYRNGVMISNLSASKSVNEKYQLFLGALNNKGTPSSFYKGSLDEVRVDGVTRSEDWVTLSYENQRFENYLLHSR